MVSGPDFGGKDTFLAGIANAATQKDQAVYDLKEWWNIHGFHPDPQEVIRTFPIALAHEPTTIGIGRYLKSELIGARGERYSARLIAEAFALDRYQLAEQFSQPYLKAGGTIIQGRGFIDSLVYQPIAAKRSGERLSREEIEVIRGNALCKKLLSHLIIVTVDEAELLIDRKRKRKKQDNSWLETLEFQREVIKEFNSRWIKEGLDMLKVPLTVINTSGTTVEETLQKGREFFDKYLAA